MKEIYRNFLLICVMTALLLGLSLWCWFKNPDDFSTGERRRLAQFPELNAESIENGSFMEDFEAYTMDQFPMREAFRGLNAFSSMKVFRQLDHNGIYEANGYLSKIEYPLNEQMLDYAASRFQSIYENQLAGKNLNIYFSIVPDKNFVLAPENGRLSLDYDALIEKMREKTSYMTYIDITGLLQADDYYRTDSHWRQEKIIDVAEWLAEEMGVTLNRAYTVHTLDTPFYGVYSGQLALPTEPDTISYLMNETLAQCTVTSYGTGSPIETVLYDWEKGKGKDPYEFFLSGAEPLIVIENPCADTDRELILFRDSFGSSLAPLLLEGYAKITLVDIRYMQSDRLEDFITFENQDVLFLYSTLLLNNSLALK